MTDRSCAGTNRRGEPCASPCVGPDGRCAAHRKGADMSALGRAGGIAAGTAKRGRSRTVRQLVAERLERDADLIYRELQEAIGRGDRVAAGAIVDRAMGVSKPQAAHLDTYQAMLERRAASRADGSRWAQHEEVVEL